MENRDGTTNDLRDAQTLPPGGADVHTVCVPDRPEEPTLDQKNEADLALKTRTASLYFATLLGIAILGFDMWLTQVTGHGYKSPDWAVAIITATYLGASGNQLAGLLKIFRRK